MLITPIPGVVSAWTFMLGVRLGEGCVLVLTTRSWCLPLLRNTSGKFVWRLLDVNNSGSWGRIGLDVCY